jgi:hypothetical protein
MAAIGNSCFLLVNLKKIFISETTWPNEQQLGRKHIWKILYMAAMFDNGSGGNYQY